MTDEHQHTDDPRSAYERFLATSAQRTPFAERWWLDLVAGIDGWHPNLLRASDGTVRAAWPLVVRRERAGLVATGAPYTPFLGPQLPERPNPQSAESLSADVELLDQLAQQLLADYAHVEAACSPELSYWTPLHWHGFTQTSRSTWRIPAGTDPVAVRSGMRKKARGALTAAERDGLVVADGTVDDLLAACAATFERQTIGSVPARTVLERVARGALEHERGEIRAVRAASGELVSAGLVVWDDRFAYNLANGRIDAAGAVGAPSLLLHDAVVRALGRGIGFDFEGSMLRPVERFVRGFGGVPCAYSAVRWSSHAWARAVARRRFVKRLTRR